MSKICLNEGQKKSVRKKEKEKIKTKGSEKMHKQTVQKQQRTYTSEKKSLCLEHVKELEFTEHIIMPLEV